MLQSVLAHGAQAPLLVHDARTARTVALLAGVLRDHDVQPALFDIGSAFVAGEVAAHLRRLAPSAAVDITGGTKVMATQAVLRNASMERAGDVTYVDGQAGLLRHLDKPVSQPLPDISLSDLLWLHDRRLVESAPADPAAPPPWPPPGVEEDPAAHRTALLALASVLRAGLPAPCEVLAGVVLERGRDGRRDSIDLLVRSAAAWELACWRGPPITGRSPTSRGRRSSWPRTSSAGTYESLSGRR